MSSNKVKDSDRRLSGPSTMLVCVVLMVGILLVSCMDSVDTAGKILLWTCLTLIALLPIPLGGVPYDA